jgi:cell division protein FtsQ
VMRLLPNRLRVSVVERTPVAFVRDGSHIGLVDANGILLDMPPGAKGDAHYSFPVVTGISASDPLSTRAARMKIFERFTGDLDSAGDKISQGLSEVDLSDPEDVKALIPNDAADVLVHFGEDDFLNRYKKFEEHLPEWRTQYPRLSSVDMRYERQVVLDMQPEPAASTSSDSSSSANTTPASAPVAPLKTAAVKSAPAARPAARSAHHAVVKAKTPVAHKPVAKGHPAARHVAAKGKPVAKGPTPIRAVSEVAFSVPTKKGRAKSAVHPAAKGHPARHSGAAKNHSSQAVHP